MDWVYLYDIVFNYLSNINWNMLQYVQHNTI